MTRKTYLAVVAAIALASSAHAADLYGSGAYGYKDAPDAPAPAWSGFYLGANGGYGWSAEDSTVYATVPHTAITTPTIGLERDGGFGGGQIGYNYQANRFVLGLEADIQGGDISGERSISGLRGSAHLDSSLDWFGTVRGRLGYEVDRALIYATGGFAYGGSSGGALVTLGGIPHSADRDATLTGFTLGGGVEYALNPRWSIKAEYQYLDFGGDHRVDSYQLQQNHTANVTYDLEPKFDTVRVGLNYRLQDIPSPLK